MPQQTATRIARLTLDEDRVLTSGSVRIHSIYVANASNAPVEVAFCDNELNPLLNMVVPPLDGDSFTGIWLADRGLTVLGLDDPDVIVTILHSAVGI